MWQRERYSPMGQSNGQQSCSTRRDTHEMKREKAPGRPYKRNGTLVYNSPYLIIESVCLRSFTFPLQPHNAQSNGKKTKQKNKFRFLSIFYGLVLVGFIVKEFVYGFLFFVAFVWPSIRFSIYYFVVCATDVDVWGTLHRNAHFISMLRFTIIAALLGT